MISLVSAQTLNESSRVKDVPLSQLLAECIAGNDAAIETLLHQYETAVFRLALSIVDDPDEASEITQDTFIAALQSLPSYQEKQSFRAWLYTIALNNGRSHIRKRKVLDRLRTTLTNIFQIETQKQVSPEEAAVQNEEEKMIWNSLNQLDERHRLVVVLRYFHELSIAEISQVLSIKEGTVHSRLHTAREKLRDSLHHLRGD